MCFCVHHFPHRGENPGSAGFVYAPAFVRGSMALLCIYCCQNIHQPQINIKNITAFTKPHVKTALVREEQNKSKQKLIWLNRWAGLEQTKSQWPPGSFHICKVGKKKIGDRSKYPAQEKKQQEGFIELSRYRNHPISQDELPFLVLEVLRFPFCASFLSPWTFPGRGDRHPLTLRWSRSSSKNASRLRRTLTHLILISASGRRFSPMTALFIQVCKIANLVLVFR